MAETALRMTGVVKRYGRRTALDGLDLAVPRGSAFGLVGSNGAGKTTCLSVAAGILGSDGGAIDLLGCGAFDAATHSGRVSLMPQDAELPLHARVIDLLVFYAQLQGLARGAIDVHIGEVLDWVHLRDRARSKVRTLSHGMRRRLVIAQAFLGSPELALLDEPLSGLDPKEVASMRELLLRRGGHRTVVISSHNLHEIERICDQVAFIEEGRLVYQGPVDAVTGRSHTVHYRIAPGDVPLARLEDALPDAHFDLLEQGRLLVCRYPESRAGTEEVNRRVLGVLIDAGIGIHEVRRGGELETAYLARRGRREDRGLKAEEVL